MGIMSKPAVTCANKLFKYGWAWDILIAEWNARLINQIKYVSNEISWVVISCKISLLVILLNDKLPEGLLLIKMK
jgi:hypothetical protein